MTVLNYSSRVPAERTVEEIHARLLRFGAREVTIRYSKAGRPEGLIFALDTAFGEQGYRLPVDTSRVLERLTREVKAGRITRGFATPAQAERVAWRTLAQWVALQLDVIDTGAVAAEAVLLPYQLLPNGRTIYDQLVSTRLQLALPPGGDQ